MSSYDLDVQDRSTSVKLLTTLLASLYVIYFLVQVRRTTYCITSGRLLEVRGGSVKKEIPVVDLQGLRPSEYLKTVFQQEHKGQQHYDLDITDSVSGVALRMTGVSGAVPDIIERWARKRAE